MRLVIGPLLVAFCWPLAAGGPDAAKTASTLQPGETRAGGLVQQILSNTCVRCHNADQKKGGLDLSRRASALKGGKTGAAIVPGNLDESLLVEKIEAGEMPPKSKLSAPDVAAIRDWIAAGAP